MRLRLVPRAVQGYAIAALAVGIASCLTLAVVHLYSFIPPNVARGLVSLGFMCAILAAAWWGGYGPGILATVSTILFAPYLAIRTYTLGQANFAQLALVLLISILVSRVAASRDKAESALRRANEMLDERVRERTAELLRANESLQQREAMLLKQAEELGRSNVDLQQFAYIASHDLQEPLRMISIYTELIERGYHGRLDHEADTFIGVVRDSVRRMDNLIRDLLSYSRAIYPESIRDSVCSGHGDRKPGGGHRRKLRGDRARRAAEGRLQSCATDADFPEPDRKFLEIPNGDAANHHFRGKGWRGLDPLGEGQRSRHRHRISRSNFRPF
jgi:K+-sensing histidine kinase KdpD